MKNFQNELAVFSKSGANGERKLRERVEMKVDTEIDEQINGIHNKTSTHSEIEEWELKSRNQDQKQRIAKDEKQVTEYKIKRWRRS